MLGRRRAFTLIELLVVVAIIAILMGMIFPVFAASRESARRTACLSNVRQLAAAIAMYSQDNDQVLPFMLISSQLGVSSSWMEQVYPYVRNGQVYRCPSDPNQESSFDGTRGDKSISYGYNFLFLNMRRLAAVEKPSQTIALMDSSGNPGEFG